MLPCDQGFFRYGHDCVPCSADCLKCSGPHPHECLTCAATHRFDERNLCVKKCQDSYYPAFPEDERPDFEKVQEGCGVCHENCKSCVSWPENACTSCKVGYYFRNAMGPWELYKNPQTGSCVETPPQGYYRKATSDTRFYQCSRGCLDCDSWFNCFLCETGYFMAFQKCHLIPAIDAVAITAETYLGDAILAAGAPIYPAKPERSIARALLMKKKNPKYYGRSEAWNKKDKLADFVRAENLNHLKESKQKEKEKVQKRADL